ncbi:PREDICTED: cardioacceleratory peptide receptor-like isoform X2 [Nicrophorus vespilloides]|uniref:Cardioacceleratory peptide receptor-like isoform X2 n=1 Tax=Nicrophorus vespilloides TaxID=110193 RepID=A0ABM1N2F1_NICVS|nr:PREDICTED: cardioacceleratory peptide receptor-like isoform X2 [Nicrophorus vespilloides]
MSVSVTAEGTEDAATVAVVVTPFEVFNSGSQTTAIPPDFNNSNALNSFYFYKTEQFTVLWVLFAMIVLGNSAVLVTLLVNKSRKSRMNFFIKQLAIADLAVGLINVSTDIVWRITVAWHAGNILCKLIRFLQAVVTYSSTYVLVALSIDRYDAITHPMNFSGSWKRAKVLVVIAWALSFIFSLPTVFLFEEKPIEGLPQCWIDLEPWQWQVYMTIVSLILFVFPALIISACYAVIVWTIWSKSKLLIPVGHVPIRHGEERRERPPRFQDEHDCRRASSRGIIPRAKIKTVKMTFVIVFVFVICWSPYIVFDLLQVYGYIPETQTNIAIATFIQSLAPLNSAANPVIYCLFSTHLCRNLRKLPPFTWMSGCLSMCFPGFQGHCLGSGDSNAGTVTTSLTHSTRRSASAASLRHTIRLQPALTNSHKVAISVV